MTSALRASVTALFTTLKRWKIVVFLFVFNLLFALVAALPILTDVDRQAGHFAGLKGFVRAFDPEILLDFVNARGGSGTDLFQLGVFGFLYFLLFNVISGGTFAILADPREPTTMKTFFRAVGLYCFRFLRLLAYYALLLALLGLINHLLTGAVCWYFEDVREYTASSDLLRWVLLGKNVFMALLLAFALLSFNYAKTAAVVEEGRFMGYYFFRGMGFCLGSPLATGLFFLISLVPIAGVVLLYRFLRAVIDPFADYAVLEGIIPWEWVVPGALVYIGAAQLAQLLFQACLVYRAAGQVHIFKRLMVYAAHPDPDLQKSIPESYFVVDSPETEGKNHA